jgi:hypothetical protein
MNKQTKAPRGINGKQRELFLALSAEQQETYLHRYNVMGQPAALAYRYTTEGY